MPWKFLTEIKFTLKQISLEMFEKDHLPSNPDMLQNALDNGPNENGYYIVEYDDEPEEYKLTIKQDETPDTAVMRRRLTAKNCGVFNGVLSIWDREISCEIKEYSHIVSIKHIG